MVVRKAKHEQDEWKTERHALGKKKQRARMQQWNDAVGEWHQSVHDCAGWAALWVKEWDNVMG